MSTSGVLGLLQLCTFDRAAWASGVVASGVLGLLLLCTLDRAAWASGVVASGVLGLLLLRTLERDGGATEADDSPLQLAGLCEDPISTSCGGLTIALLPSTRCIWVKKRKLDCVISSSDSTPAPLRLCLSTTSL